MPPGHVQSSKALPFERLIATPIHRVVLKIPVKGENNESIQKISHMIWHCQYHMVWVPKYRHRILTGHVGDEVGNCTRAFSEQKEVEIIAMSIQPDHVHLVTMIPP
ncbi:MAG: IS200/IS605 family transposase, partial [Thermodesulfobacteriota bacterium]|nr:IS200/IS605 family transposase [Thermodesulfobacteriota bacterium]